MIFACDFSPFFRTLVWNFKMPAVHPQARIGPTERKNIKPKYILGSFFTTHWMPPGIYLHILQYRKKGEQYKKTCYIWMKFHHRRWKFMILIGLVKWKFQKAFLICRPKGRRLFGFCNMLFSLLSISQPGSNISDVVLYNNFAWPCISIDCLVQLENALQSK